MSDSVSLGGSEVSHHTVDVVPGHGLGLPETCYVRALYPFTSTESSSLNFRAGDLVRVLTKLESGWWDGFLRGERGWFPSNYVEEVELVSSDDEGDEPDFSPVFLRNAKATHSDGDTLQSPTVSPLQSREYDEDEEREDATLYDDSNEAAFWIPQTTEDGSIYFFNTVTGTSRWDLPLTPIAAITGSRAIATYQTPITTGIRVPDADTGTALAAQERSTQQASAPRHPDSRGEDRGHGGGGGRDHTNGRLPTAHHDENDGEDYDEEDEDSGKEQGAHDRGDDNGEILLFAMPGEDELASSVHRPSEFGADMSQVPHPVADQSTLRRVAGCVDEMNQSVTPLAANMAAWSSSCVEIVTSLTQSVRASRVEDYETYCRSLKALVGEMLQGLGLTKFSLAPEFALEAESPRTFHETQVPWKTQYRKILAAISKLDLSARIATKEWGYEDAPEQMLLAAAEVQNLVLELVKEAAQVATTSIVLRPKVLPRLTRAGGWQGNGVQTAETEVGRMTIPLSSDTVTDLEDHAKSVRAESKLCKLKLRQYDRECTLAHGAVVLKSAMEILGLVKQMLEYCEQIDLSALDPARGSNLPRSPTISDFANAKQLIYDASGSIVLAAQSLTSLSSLELHANRVSNEVTAMDEALGELGTALQSTIMHAEFMVQEHVAKYLQADAAHSLNEVVLESDSTRRGGRMKKFFGEVPEPNTLVPQASPQSARYVETTQGAIPSASFVRPQSPWFLKHELEDDLTYDTKGNVKAGTLLALVERLTRHDVLDTVYNNTFLLTYRSFTSAEELSSLLMQRFLIEPPAGLTTSEIDLWVELKQSPIQLRVFNIFKSWMENFFMEPPTAATRDWLTRMKHFARSVMAEHISTTTVLTKLIEKRIVQGDVPFRRLVLNTTTQPPAPIVPRNLRKIRLLDLDPLEVARQLTLMESNLYNKIKPTECLDKSWSKPDAAEGAENIKAMILHSNQITAWVAEAILYQTDLKKRVSLIKHFVFIAEKCRTLSNFSTLTAIISGLNSAPIHRLRRTWDLLNARVAMSAEDLNRLMNSSKNFSKYREALHQTQPPCVPFLGVYLTDLTFIEDGNPNMSVKARHLINISKRQKTADVIRDIQQYQAVPYPLQAVPEIQSYIRSCMDITRDISELYNISLEREPREREDEKIARLLQESGFL